MGAVLSPRSNGLLTGAGLTSAKVALLKGPASVAADDFNSDFSGEVEKWPWAVSLASALPPSIFFVEAPFCACVWQGKT